MPELIDVATPDSAKTRTGFDGQEYDLVFSDEFEVDGRTFYPGDDTHREAVDLQYGRTNDQEWYDLSQITTKGGRLSILLENSPEHGLQYSRWMLKSWNKFCFTNRYIEVSMTLPRPNAETTGYVSRFWFHAFCLRWGFVLMCDCVFFSGLPRGRWVILGDLVMEGRPVACSGLLYY
jgi:beta-glucan synthesis-associated protein KRE6